LYLPFLVWAGEGAKGRTPASRPLSRLLVIIVETPVKMRFPTVPGLTQEIQREKFIDGGIDGGQADTLARRQYRGLHVPPSEHPMGV
jgi:hypothetical protein